jgi:hypothetical protein
MSTASDRDASVPEPVARAAELFDDFGRTWFLVGGWAVDAWLGKVTRDHGDVDVAIFTDDQRALLEHLPDWHLVGHDPPEQSHDDAWDGRVLGFPAHIHARKPAWPEFDFALNLRSGADWILNREPWISVPFDDAVRPSPWGLPTLVPELIVWHKATDEPRPRDELDFAALAPLLDDARRAWLAESIALINSRHPWLPSLLPGASRSSR